MLVLIAGFLSTLFGLPGTVVIFGDVLVYAVATGFAKVGFKVLLILAILMIIAEAIEFSLGIWGAARFGASKKALWASVIGGIIGAALLTPYLIGLGTLIGAFAGGFAGVLFIELIHHQRLKPALRAGIGALLGRICGTLAKGLLSLAMIVVALINIYS